MLFNFLKYLQPTHYFQLYRKDGASIFPKIESLSKDVLEQITPDSNFKSEQARAYDLSWQAINKGYIGTAETYTSFKRLPLEDEYRFIRKYFHPTWAFYVLLIRLFSFNNPINEITAFKKSYNTVRSNYLKQPIVYKNWFSFDSKLVSNKPLVSVVIPTLNRYEFLKNVLKDFEQQTYKHFEILIIDQSKPFQEDFCKGFNLNIRHIQQSEPALWFARNSAIKKSKGTNKVVRLYIAGNGPYKNQLEQLAVDLGLEDEVIFLGLLNVHEMTAFYEAMDVVVLPSFHEAFGLVFIEAIAMGTPVLVSNSFGALDFIDPEKFSLEDFCFHPQEIQELIDKLEPYLHDKGLPAAYFKRMYEETFEKAVIYKQVKAVILNQNIPT